MLHYSYQGIRKITNYEERQWYFLLSTTIWHWHSTTLMGLNQAVSTGKPVAKYSYQRHACFLREEFSHPERSNKIPGLLQNNLFVDFLSAKLKLMHSEVRWWKEVFFPVEVTPSAVNLAFCAGPGFGGNVLGGWWQRIWPREPQSLQQPQGGGLWQDASAVSTFSHMDGGLLAQGSL